MPLPNVRIPLTRFPTLFPGTEGVPGADVPLGLRTGTRNVVIYVDHNMPGANDGNDGTNPASPKQHLQAAIDYLATGFIGNLGWGNAGDIIVVAGSCNEAVVTYDYGFGPSYVTIMGSWNTRFAPTLYNTVNAAAPCLSLRAPGFRITNLTILPPTGAAGIELHHTDLTGNDIAIDTVIDGVHFFGQDTGFYGIATHGCYNMEVLDNVFEHFHHAGNTGTAIISLACPFAIPFRCRILGNYFLENDNHINIEANDCIIAYNTFTANGISWNAIRKLYTNGGIGAGGNLNQVFMNHMPGDYSIAGGYSGAATDHWNGNMAEDVAEAEVGDNGWTIAIPS